MQLIRLEEQFSLICYKIIAVVVFSYANKISISIIPSSNKQNPKKHFAKKQILVQTYLPTTKHSLLFLIRTRFFPNLIWLKEHFKYVNACTYCTYVYQLECSHRHCGCVCKSNFLKIKLKKLATQRKIQSKRMQRLQCEY